MSVFGSLIPKVVRRYLGRLRFPTLFVLTGLLFVADLLVPDAIPFADEILLALGTLLLGRLREKSGGEQEAEGDGDPSDRLEVC